MEDTTKDFPHEQIIQELSFLFIFYIHYLKPDTSTIICSHSSQN